MDKVVEYWQGRDGLYFTTPDKKPLGYGPYGTLPRLKGACAVRFSRPSSSIAFDLITAPEGASGTGEPAERLPRAAPVGVTQAAPATDTIPAGVREAALEAYAYLRYENAAVRSPDVTDAVDVVLSAAFSALKRLSA